MVPNFEELCLELLWTIASFCDFPTLEALSSTSSRIRFNLTRFIHKRAVFSNNDIGVSSKLEEFLRGDVSLFNNLIPYTTIRSATFEVRSDPDPLRLGRWGTHSRDPSWPEVSILPWQICRSIQVMVSLQTLNLRVENLGPGHVECFCRFIQNIQISVLHLRVNGTLPIIKKILKQCSQLEALHVSHVVISDNFNNIMVEVRSPGKIQRLAIVLAADPHTAGVRVPSLRCDLISNITHKFANLTELILHEANFDYHPFSRYHPTEEGRREEFRTALNRAIGELQVLRKLKRLAITIHVRVAERLYPSASQNVMIQCYPMFYKSCISTIGSAMPWLDQIIILASCFGDWDGHRRGPDDIQVRFKSFEYDQDSFPVTVTKGY